MQNSVYNRKGLLVYWLVFLAALLMSLVDPSGALAHEKWFLDATRYPLMWELLVSWPVAFALIVAAVTMSALILLRRFVGDPLFPNPPWLQPVNSSVQAVVGVQTAISLTYMTVKGWLLAPTLSAPGDIWGFSLLALQLFVSFTFITGWLTRIGGGLLIGLTMSTFLFFSPSIAAEQLLFAGIGLYFLIKGRGLFIPNGTLVTRLNNFWIRYASVALPAMRIFTGLSILWLAFSEKLLNPKLALAFLQTRPEFNFVHLLGFTGFTDEFFVYAAAAVEVTVGVMLMAGVLPRVVIFFMWVPFNIAIPLLPPEELLGHLPILAVMYAVFLGEARKVPATEVGEPIAATARSSKAATL